MTDIKNLYQEIILDHGRNPRNFKELNGATHMHEGHNPLCGDRLIIFLKVHNGLIEEASFTGGGCAISMASASLMVAELKGKKLSDLDMWIDDFVNMIVKGEKNQYEGEKLGVLSGVSQYPMRVKCATLSWHTLRAAKEKSKKQVSTE